MDCKHFRNDIISESASAEFRDHITECDSCRELLGDIDSVMEMLDHIEPVPENLLASIMKKQSEVQMPKVRSLNFVSYLQIAAAIIFGIFIGHKFGENAKAGSFRTKADPVSQYIQAHHLNVEDTGYKISSLYLK